MPAGVEKMVRVSIAQRRRLTEGDKMAGRHGNKGVISRVVPVEDMPFLDDGTPIDIILNPLGVPGRMNIGQVLETHLGWAADRLGFMAETPVFDGAQEDEIESELARAWLIDRAWQDVTQRAWAYVHEQKIENESLMDDNDARRLYLLEWLEPRGYEPESLFFDEKYARNSALAEWLQERGYESESVIPETRSDASDRYARYVSLREWLLYHGYEPDDDALTEAADDRILEHLATVEQLDDTLLEEIAEAAQRHSRQVGWPLPTTGKQKLFDGKTGEPYDAHVTIGIAQMLKLHHLVEDKVHARSTGPYSLVTQQPLGGKAQFGGQRFGEMEVWALEAYGAAYTLQEMLTIKSDDTTGRVKTYEAIVKGDAIQSPGVPESFRVLVKELQSLALSIEVINDKNEIIQLGKDEVEDRLPHLGFSLNVPSPMSRSSE
jgi:DNA-directed RNA polymerase subunit beta